LAVTLKITHKNSTTAGTPPAAGDIDVGEIAINAADGKLYTKDTAGDIQAFTNDATIASTATVAQSAVGAVNRTIESKLGDFVSVKDFGATGDGVSDDAGAFQAAINYIQSRPRGGTLYIPSGSYKLISGNVLMDRSSDPSLSRVSIRGEDMYSTRIIYAATADECIHVVNSQTANENTAYITISDLWIEGPALRTDSKGIFLDLAPWVKIERVYIQGFDYGAYFRDVDQFYAHSFIMRFNRKGLRAFKKIDPPGPYSTSTNNHVYVSCTWAVNYDYGATWEFGTEICLIGGNVAQNGGTPLVAGSGFGLKFLNCGYGGGRAANLQGVYIEGNQGLADVVLEASNVETTPYLNTVHHISSSFKRLGTPNTSKNAQNHILCNFGDPATVGRQVLLLVGSSFRVYPGYTESGATPVIKYGVTPADNDNFFDYGSYYQSSVERPALARSTKAKDASVYAASAQTFTSGVAAQWDVDTVSDTAGYPLWTPTFDAGKIVIDEEGEYLVSVNLVLSAFASGLKRVRLLKNTTIIGVSEFDSTYNVVSCTVSCRFNVNDTLSVNFLQSSGGPLDVIVASPVRMHITKVY
jgi:hypothetical protein